MQDCVAVNEMNAIIINSAW